MMATAEFLDTWVNKNLHKFLDDRAKKWLNLNVRVTMPQGNPYFKLWMSGQPERESDTSTLWYVYGWIEPDLADNERYIEGIMQNAYESLMLYTDCSCKYKGIKWHPDSDGDLVVPEFQVEQCSLHKRINGEERNEE